MLFLTYKRGPQIKSNEYRYGNENASLACCSAFVFYCKENSLFCSLFFHYRRSLSEVFVFFFDPVVVLAVGSVNLTLRPQICTRYYFGIFPLAAYGKWRHTKLFEDRKSVV